MNESNEDMNRAIIAEGRGLAAGKSFRLVMAFTLLVAGLSLLYFGLTTGRRPLIVPGIIFTMLSILVCFVIRQTERVIRRLEDSLNRLNARLERGKNGKVPDKKN